MVSARCNRVLSAEQLIDELAVLKPPNATDVMPASTPRMPTTTSNSTSVKPPLAAGAVFLQPGAESTKAIHGESGSGYRRPSRGG